MSTAKPHQQLTPFGHALAGALGGVFSNSVVYPLDTVKTRIQAANASAKGKRRDLSIIALLLRILREEGILAFYNGFGASMLNSFSTQYAYFFFYSFVRGSYMKRLAGRLPKGAKPPPISTAMELLLGAIAGALAQIFTIPVSVIATRQQLGKTEKKQNGKNITPYLSADGDTTASLPAKFSYSYTSDPEPASDLALQNTSEKSASSRKKTSEDDEDEDDMSFMSVARRIVHEEGVTGLWLGLKLSLVLTINPAITYGMFERVKSLMLLAKERTGRPPKLTPWEAFFVGAFSKTLATIVTYPYIMAKVRIQAGVQGMTGDLQTPASSKARHDGAVQLLTRVLKEEGFSGWYQGMGAQILKAVLSQALLFMSKDQFEQYTFAVLAMHRTVLKAAS